MEILYHDGPVIVVNKPAGLQVQAPPGIDSLVNHIKTYIRQKEHCEGKNIYLGVPHRLDRPATGCMLFARHVRAAQRLSLQFQMRTIIKKYWTLVEGRIPDTAGSWEDFIIKVPGEARAEIVSADHTEARWALLHYKVMHFFPEKNCSWLEIELETGRTHQIRIQCASRGFPILGDFQYGAKMNFGQQFSDKRLQAIALHSRKLGFRHPMRDEMIEITAPLFPEWTDFSEKFCLPCDFT
ncbi:MAG: RluA family pseudouridine synthase [Planctomycetia bacterium]|nr:RluA family pseudouridine synthase [Planctomycetia bacterium]